MFLRNEVQKVCTFKSDTSNLILFLKCYSGRSLDIKSKYSESILDMLAKNIIFIVFNTTFNNISVISWRSDLPGSHHQLGPIFRNGLGPKMLFISAAPRTLTKCPYRKSSAVLSIVPVVIISVLFVCVFVCVFVCRLFILSA